MYDVAVTLIRIINCYIELGYNEITTYFEVNISPRAFTICCRPNAFGLQLKFSNNILLISSVFLNFYKQKFLREGTCPIHPPLLFDSKVIANPKNLVSPVIGDIDQSYSSALFI